MIQRKRLGVLAYVILFLAISGVPGEVSAAANDNHGKEWRQLTETVGLTWNQVAQVCPRDGISPCSGVVGGRDLSGWVWATDVQVITLFSYFEPDILTSPSISGMQYFFTATPFLSFLRPTFSFTITYQSGGFTAGWTASVDAAGSPIAGSVSVGTTPVSVGGSFSVAPRSDPNEVESTRGVFLWRDTGLAGNAPFAYDDAGLVPSPDGGTAVASVLANDWMGGAPATTANVLLSQVSSTHPGLILNLSDGSLDVASGTQAGTYMLVYQICAIGSPTNCDSATVTVLVKPYVIDAVNDAGTASPSTGGTAVADVLANDRLGNARPTPANVTLFQLSSGNPGVTLDVSDGSVDVAQGTALGTFALVYRICETANPTNCDQATATVIVKPYDIDAVDDQVRASSKTGGTVIASVLANDWFAGARATTAKVSLSLVSLTPAAQGITLDPSDGSVDVVPKTNSGLYKLIYKICEITSPANCDQATVTIDLSGKTP